MVRHNAHQVPGTYFLPKLIYYQLRYQAKQPLRHITIHNQIRNDQDVYLVTSQYKIFYGTLLLYLDADTVAFIGIHNYYLIGNNTCIVHLRYDYFQPQPLFNAIKSIKENKVHKHLSDDKVQVSVLKLKAQQPLIKTNLNSWNQIIQAAQDQLKKGQYKYIYNAQENTHTKVYLNKPVIPNQDKKGKSKNENKIEQYLIKNQIKYQRQKSYRDLRDRLPLYYDFYLPHYHLLIEYDGELHFKSVKAYGGNPKLKRTQYHDRLKDEYAKHHHIDLLRIKYNENVLEKLATTLNQKNKNRKEKHE